jgi:7,8-dihydropterin-6-yl-methyl-4-(beta-D-ribofuranosyl)aminobenzene 5'-phosphate synthase
VLPSKDVPSVDSLNAHGAQVINTVEPQILLDNMFCVSGEIPRVTPFEQGLAEHYQRTSDGQAWEPDPWIIDERCLIIHIEGKGLAVFTACSHAGVINVLKHSQQSFPTVPIYAVMGGFHLAGPNQPLIPKIVDAMKAFDMQLIAAGHCTGWRALSALAHAFGDRVVDPSVVGKRYKF